MDVLCNKTGNNSFKYSKKINSTKNTQIRSDCLCIVLIKCGLPGTHCYPSYPFVKVTSPLLLITQNRKPCMTSSASSCHHQVHCDGWVDRKARVLAKKSAEGQLSSAVEQTNSFVGLSGQGQHMVGAKVADVFLFF